MGYAHINNLYKPEIKDLIFLFREVWAMEKIHGTSTHITFNPADNTIHYFSGGTKHDSFVAIFDATALLEKFKAMSLPTDRKITIFGEGYGGKEQGMSHTYGKQLKFIAFDVQIGDFWLDVPNACKVATDLGLEFVFFNRIPVTIEALNAERDRPSTQAIRNGITTLGANGELINPRPSEGIVIRPIREMTLNNGARICAKHKSDAFRETSTPRSLETDAAKLAVLSEANAIAAEWVTLERLGHVLQRIPDASMEKMPIILASMEEDVLREAGSEIDLSKNANAIKKAIKSATAKLFQQFLQKRLADSTKIV